MNVLFAASELTPLIKVSAVADAVAALPRHLSALGADARIIIPDYPQLAHLSNTFRQVAQFDLRLPDQHIQATIKQGTLPDAAIPLYLVNLSQGLSAPSVYPTLAQGDQDRFPLFCQAVVQWLQAQPWQPDVLHAHDWPTALLPLLAHQHHLSYKTILTIHNLASQGKIDRHYLINAGITPPTAAKQCNMLKIGIAAATKVTTVSPTYAKEILGRAYGHHLEAELRRRAKDLSGILNGLDYTRYASRQPAIPASDQTTRNSIDSKIINKELLKKEIGLLANKQKPLFAVLGPIDKQRGVDLVEKLVKDTPFLLYAQMVILGRGSQEWERKLTRLVKKHTGQLAICIRDDVELFDRILASSDFILMPSQFEPCGQAQMIALKYGTLPIVRHTGGLADTVVDAHKNLSRGTGFTFNQSEVGSLQTAVDHALDLYDNKPALAQVIENAIKQDFAWGKSARQYLDLYQSALKARRQSKPSRK